MQLHAALLGRVEDEIASAGAWLAEVVTRSADEESAPIVTKLREDVAQSGLRNAGRMKTSWRRELYPAKGKSLSPAVWLYSNLPATVAAFEEGKTVRSPLGKWLTIPNPVLFPARTRRRQGRTSMLDIAEARFGPLRFVIPRAGSPVAYLVATLRASQKHPGRFRRASERALRTGRDLATVIVFFLVRQARLPRLLKGATIRKRAERDWPAGMERRVRANMARVPRPRVIAGSYRP